MFFEDLKLKNGKLSPAEFDKIFSGTTGFAAGEISTGKNKVGADTRIRYIKVGSKENPNVSFVFVQGGAKKLGKDEWIGRQARFVYGVEEKDGDFVFKFNKKANSPDAKVVLKDNLSQEDSDKIAALKGELVLIHGDKELSKVFDATYGQISPYSRNKSIYENNSEEIKFLQQQLDESRRACAEKEDELKDRARKIKESDSKNEEIIQEYNRLLKEYMDVSEISENWYNELSALEENMKGLSDDVLKTHGKEFEKNIMFRLQQIGKRDKEGISLNQIFKATAVDRIALIKRFAKNIVDEGAVDYKSNKAHRPDRKVEGIDVDFKNLSESAKETLIKYTVSKISNLVEKYDSEEFAAERNKKIAQRDAEQSAENYEVLQEILSKVGVTHGPKTLQERFKVADAKNNIATLPELKTLGLKATDKEINELQALIDNMKGAAKEIVKNAVERYNIKANENVINKANNIMVGILATDEYSDRMTKRQIDLICEALQNKVLIDTKSQIKERLIDQEVLAYNHKIDERAADLLEHFSDEVIELAGIKDATERKEKADEIVKSLYAKESPSVQKVMANVLTDIAKNVREEISKLAQLKRELTGKKEAGAAKSRVADVPTSTPAAKEGRTDEEAAAGKTPANNEKNPGGAPEKPAEPVIPEIYRLKNGHYLVVGSNYKGREDENTLYVCTKNPEGADLSSENGRNAVGANGVKKVRVDAKGNVVINYYDAKQGQKTKTYTLKEKLAEGQKVSDITNWAKDNGKENLTESGKVLYVKPTFKTRTILKCAGAIAAAGLLTFTGFHLGANRYPNETAKAQDFGRTQITSIMNDETQLFTYKDAGVKYYKYNGEKSELVVGKVVDKLNDNLTIKVEEYKQQQERKMLGVLRNKPNYKEATEVAAWEEVGKQVAKELIKNNVPVYSTNSQDRVALPVYFAGKTICDRDAMISSIGDKQVEAYENGFASMISDSNALSNNYEQIITSEGTQNPPPAGPTQEELNKNALFEAIKANSAMLQNNPSITADNLDVVAQSEGVMYATVSPTLDSQKSNYKDYLYIVNDAEISNDANQDLTEVDFSDATVEEAKKIESYFKKLHTKDGNSAARSSLEGSLAKLYSDYEKDAVIYVKENNVSENAAKPELFIVEGDNVSEKTCDEAIYTGAPEQLDPMSLTAYSILSGFGYNPGDANYEIVNNYVEKTL